MKNSHFIIAGGPRCGSTYLYHLCSEHPEILMARPVVPEPKYFLKDASLIEYNDYLRRYFPDAVSFPILGEKSVRYLEKPETALKIKQCLPNVKIVVILRDPIKRAVSNYWFSRRHGLETRSLAEVFSRLEDRPPAGALPHPADPFNYLSRGLYLRQLEAYEEVFGREKLFIMCLENLIRGGAELASLFAFLEADPHFRPANFHQVINASEPSEKLDRKTWEGMADYFKGPSSLLAGRYGLDISAWFKTEVPV